MSNKKPLTFLSPVFSSLRISPDIFPSPKADHTLIPQKLQLLVDSLTNFLLRYKDQFRSIALNDLVS